MRKCPHGCRGSLQWAEDAWFCPTCRNEWHADLEPAPPSFYDLPPRIRDLVIGAAAKWYDVSVLFDGDDFTLVVEGDDTRWYYAWSRRRTGQWHLINSTNSDKDDITIDELRYYLGLGRWAEAGSRSLQRSP